jgi:hypothetical protein
MAANNVNSMVNSATPLVEDMVTKAELKYMLKTSEILRSVLKDNPSSFPATIANDTLVLKGPRLQWLIDHATHIKDTMELLSSDGCPENTYIEIPETKASRNDAEPAAFRFLQHYAHEEPVGEITMKNGKMSITMFPIFEEGLPEDVSATAHLANVLHYLMWNHSTPEEQVNDLIECGLLVNKSVLYHSSGNKAARAAKLASSSAAAFNESMLEQNGNWNNIGAEYENFNNNSETPYNNNNNFYGENGENYSAAAKPHMKKVKPSKSKRKVNRKRRGTRKTRR